MAAAASKSKASKSKGPGFKASRPKASASKENAERDAIVPPSAESGGVPSPADHYLYVAALTSRRLPVPRPILVVMDLNGTLLYRPQPRNRPKHFVARPVAREFLTYCLTYFRVVIWSSARPENVAGMLKQLLPDGLCAKMLGRRQGIVVEEAKTADQQAAGGEGQNVAGPYVPRPRPPVAVWSRANFGLTAADYAKRVQCYKRLSMVWADPVARASHPAPAAALQAEAAATASVGAPGLQDILWPKAADGHTWSQFDTVLVDDSREKARSEPHNLIEVPEFVGAAEKDIVMQVHDYLNELAHQSNISAYIRMHPFRAMTTGSQEAGP